MRIVRFSWLWPVSAAVAFGLAAACSDSTGPSGPIQLTVSVTSSGPTGEAFLITLSGDSISGPAAADPGHLLYSFASGNTVKVAVVGSLSSGDLLRFSVPRGSLAADYSAVLEQVAGSDNALQPVGEYTLTVN
ncbi:MAG: hypothetical protein JSU87_02165 [Gemmatimonadota bacterium]|nr:MAG: hypothetical protein JSU87_02165 [Gemmatimonadota bacterium]